MQPKLVAHSKNTRKMQRKSYADFEFSESSYEEIYCWGIFNILNSHEILDLLFGIIQFLAKF